MAHPRHEIFQVHSADDEENVYTTNADGKIILRSELKLSYRLKEISDALHSARREQLNIGICYEDWEKAAKDCTNNQNDYNCDEFRNKTNICSPLYCPIVLNYKGA